MDTNWKQLKSQVYDKCGLEISAFKMETESKDYSACQFELNGQKVICRNSKITPKKSGQFVSFWKRSAHGPIAPFEENDSFYFFVVNVRTEKDLGQFVFPKSVLIKKGIISTPQKEGKRAFRVYPKWDITKSKQAEKTQKWQLNYFYEIKDSMDLKKVVELYTVD